MRLSSWMWNISSCICGEYWPQQFLSPLVRYSYHDEKLLFGTELDKINSAKSGGMFLHFRNLPGSTTWYCQQHYLLARIWSPEYAVLSFSGLWWWIHREAWQLRVIQFKVKGKLRDMCFKTCWQKRLNYLSPRHFFIICRWNGPLSCYYSTFFQ